MPISDQDVQKYRCILMYDDERVLDAVAAFRDAQQAAEWWTLAVDLSGGKYAVTSFADVSARIKDGRQAFLARSLGSLVGDLLKPVDVVVEQASSDFGAVQQKASATPSQMAVVVDGGEFKGVLPAATTRGPGGLFGPELVKLAGQYAAIPTSGVLSKRRLEAMAAKRKKAEGGGHR